MADDAFLSHLIGTSEHLGDVRERCAWLGPLRPTVALVGESGTGKTLVARELHERGGPRRPFVRVSLSRLGHSLVDGELLGHAKGAFTGADRPHVGFLEQAQGGSLVLDDFQDACERAQALLLEFADRQGQVALMGTRGWRPDARIIVVTQVPLAELAKDTVRADLIYRLDDVSIHLLPLREHMEDLPALVPHLLGQVAQELGLPLPHLADPLLDALARYTWPGNVRELEHA